MKEFIKWLLKPIANFFRKITYKLMRDVIKRLERTMRSANANRNQVQDPFIPYNKDELVRIMFLFQAASFWPSWESFYKACISDPRIRVEFTLLDELYGDTTQMLTAKQFLDDMGIEYKIYSDNLCSKFSPHILVMQTPYDFGHRKLHVRSAAFRRKGIRIVYIPYGIELSDTEHARDAHFLNAVVRNSWRVFTFSERMREDYWQFCPNYSAVKCLGSPKFDALYHREWFQPLTEIAQRTAGRPVLVWHVHFPKLVPQPDGNEFMATPELEIYLDFAKYIIKRKDIFVVLLPHPKFLDGEGKLGLQAKDIVALLSASDNAYVDWSDDYRNTMLNCQFLITDRSALMIEAATTGIPILYMTNKKYFEPLTPAIQPIIDSYYHGTTFQEMQEFVDQCLRGEDPMKKRREIAFRETIPYFDGQSGERIKEHIVDAIMQENRDNVAEQVAVLTEEVRQLSEKLDTLLK